MAKVWWRKTLSSIGASLLPAMPAMAARWLPVLALLSASPVLAVGPPAPAFEAVAPGLPLRFPRDFGAHPSFKTEWWYVTGWIETPDERQLGFQLTFFRSATGLDGANPSAFAPKQLVIAHAALSDPALGHLLHDEKSAREGFGLAYASQGDTDVKLGDWQLLREADGAYRAQVPARDFTLQLTLSPAGPPLPQGRDGYSRKGPQPAQASFYYSRPQLSVRGTLIRRGQGQGQGRQGSNREQPVAVNGKAWLDHEWSTSALDSRADGWDWLGVNLDNGDALMAFQIRGADGKPLWAHAALQEKSGRVTQFSERQVSFAPVRRWRSPRTGATYPVQTAVTLTQRAASASASATWTLTPLLDDQELDSRRSTGAVYWEGAVTVARDGQRAGQGYLEMTGYVKPFKF